MNKSVRTALAGLVAVVALLAGSVSTMAGTAMAATSINGNVTSMSSGAMTVQVNGSGAAAQKVDTRNASIASGIGVGSAVNATGEMMADGTLKASSVSRAGCAGSGC